MRHLVVSSFVRLAWPDSVEGTYELNIHVLWIGP